MVSPATLADADLVFLGALGIRNHAEQPSQNQTVISERFEKVAEGRRGKDTTKFSTAGKEGNLAWKHEHKPLVLDDDCSSFVSIVRN